MSVVVELALLLSRSARSGLLPNKSIGLNIIAITSGVAFLAFALAIYDGYREKVERIIFSLTPHIMVRPTMKLAPEDEDSRDELAVCLKVCRAPFTVHTSANGAKGTTVAFDAGKVQALTRWLAANAPAGTSASRVLFEETKLEIRTTAFSTEGLREMRLLGLDTFYGSAPAPRVDLTFSEDGVRERFRQGTGILISDALANEIARADGSSIIPGRTTIRIGPADRLREVQIAGIHRLGIHAVSRNLLIMPYRLAADLLEPDAAPGPSYVGLTLADPENARDVVDRMRGTLRSQDLAAIAWQSVTDLFDQLELYRWIIFVTLSLSILVTAINTFVNISILIMQRVEQIGILRAMGLSPAQLLTVFAAVGVVQSAVGTALGYGLGILIGYLLDDYINSLVRDFIPITDARIAPDPLVFASLLGFVAVVSVIACLLAAHRALKNEISDNLRAA